MKKAWITLLLLTGVSSALFSQSYQKRLALVIGNSNYRNGGTLKNPVNDARAMASTLESFGFEVLKHENVGQADMKKAINDFGQKLRGYEVGIFYYAGHGIQSKGTNYMIPTEASLQSEEQIEFDCVAADRVLAFMETAATKVNVIIMDACRNNPFERSWHRSANGNGLAMMNAPSGSLIAYATSPGRVASDGESSNGLYTSALLKFMRNPSLTIEQVFKQVRNEVSEKSGGAQVPWETTSLTGKDFYFTSVAGSDPVAFTATPISPEKSMVARKTDVTITPENKSRSEIFYKLGKASYDAVKDAKAIEEFSKAIDLNPSLPDAYYWRGNAYYNMQEYDKAKFDYSASIDLNPNFSEAYYWRGNANFAVKQDNAALEDFTRAIKINPAYPEAYYWRGRTNYELIQDARAMEDFKKCIQLKPEYADAHYWKGRVNYSLKDFNLAIEDFTRTIDLKPTFAEVFYWRANAKFSLKMNSEAIDDFTKSIQLKPDYAEAYFYRGKVEYTLKMDDPSLQDFIKASELKTNYADAIYWCGMTRYVAAKYEDAIAYFSKAIDINPQMGDAYYYRANSKYVLKLDDEALADFNKTIELKPFADAYYWRGVVYYAQKNYSEAAIDFTSAIELDPTGPLAYKYYYMRGNSFFVLQMDQDNINDQTKSIEKKSDYAESWYLRGCSRVYSGQTNVGLTDINKAIELDPANTKYTDFKAKNFK